MGDDILRFDGALGQTNLDTAFRAPNSRARARSAAPVPLRAARPFGSPSVASSRHRSTVARRDLPGGLGLRYARSVQTRYDDLIARLRSASRPGRPAPPALNGYLELVRRHAYRVTDRDVEELKAAGFSEDEIFEHTVAAAVAAGLDRRDAGLSALR